MEKIETKKFILEFFKNSKVTEKNGVLLIQNASEDFEKFLGEKAPYTLVFDSVTHNRVENSELIAKGSYFLLAIRDYLRGKGQTSLVKINADFEKIDVKKYLKLGGWKIKDITERYQAGFIPKFTFYTVSQYLNKKKQVMHNITVKKGNVVDFDFSKFRITSGNKGEVSNIDFAGDYQAAKEKLSEILENEAEEIKKELCEKLEEELGRIKKYYGKQKREKDDELERVVEKIKMLEAKLKHTYYRRDADILRRMIRETNTQLEKLKTIGYEERLKGEEEFHLNDEKEKHALLVDSSLMHCMVYYYLIKVYFVVLVNGKKIKKVEFGYDPILKEVHFVNVEKEFFKIK